MRNIMKRAWRLSKNAVLKFGGSSKQYFAAALAIAWRESKTKVVKCRVASLNCDMVLNTETRELSGDTYRCKDFLKKHYYAKWDSHKKVWVLGDPSTVYRGAMSPVDVFIDKFAC